MFLGYSRAMVRDTRAEDFCRTISNFSLEYRSMRQAVLLQRERQKIGGESPGPSTPVGRRKGQLTPASQVGVSNPPKPNHSTPLAVKGTIWQTGEKGNMWVQREINSEPCEIYHL